MTALKSHVKQTDDRLNEKLKIIRLIINASILTKVESICVHNDKGRCRHIRKSKSENTKHASLEIYLDFKFLVVLIVIPGF